VPKVMNIAKKAGDPRYVELRARNLYRLYRDDQGWTPVQIAARAAEVVADPKATRSKKATWAVVGRIARTGR
jgi:hypothetical protein